MADIKDKLLQVEENAVAFAKMSTDIVKKYTEELDSIMNQIHTMLLVETSPSTDVLEKYLLTLTNTLFFVGEQAENLGVFDDVSKATFKDAYNKAYLDNQLTLTEKNKKPTVAESTATAENQTIEDSMVNAIYARAYRLFKFKVDAGYEMVKSISKIISKRMNEQSVLPETSSKQLLNEGWETL